MKFYDFDIAGVQCEWGYSPPQWGVRCEKETDSDDRYLQRIGAYYRERGVWAISDLIYFDSDQARSLFYLTWPPNGN